eukprot:TRINITY_DN3698_c0_g1_i1.p1 TRINITY_DN3698_c0_g1~~TRINITY_DN3698_c0_g1_i1.p1  ORF type:complete len:262 (+),score=53.42 TRINITY_DN3698_c0_g1_i1:273-1058(+)
MDIISPAKEEDELGGDDVPPPPMANEQRGKFLIQGVGGSVTVLLQLAVLAFGIRHLRNMIAKRRERKQAEGGPEGTPGFATITAAALSLLIELEAAPYQVVDVRRADEAKAKPLPFQENVARVAIPEADFHSALLMPVSAWEHRYAGAKPLEKRQLLVMLSADGEKARKAAATAASLGYTRCCVLEGGLESLERSVEEFEAAPVKWINSLGCLLPRQRCVGCAPFELVIRGPRKCSQRCHVQYRRRGARPQRGGPPGRAEA